ncbi:turripeptide Pal9.2 [Diabrotica undecimpunctata]|uniref:turripeptide Pal9.2 n=1 Tax=Diabrotica undecimpunctata TaxID=50387 RepID=UPI003B633754
MKLLSILCFVIFIVLVLLSVAYGVPSKGSTKASLQKKPCLKDCSAVDYKPVCGGDGTGKGDKSFGSECVLGNFNCEHSTTLKVVKVGECPGGGSIRLQ